MADAVCGLAIMREAQRFGVRSVRAFWRIMPEVWVPEVWREEDLVTVTGGDVVVGSGIFDSCSFQYSILNLLFY